MPRFLVSTTLPSLIQATETFHWSNKSERPESLTHSPITDFTLFSTLPAEIRLKIWSKIISDSSLIIDIWTEYRRSENRNTLFYHQHYSTKFTDTLSRVLWANHESREESLKLLPLEFGTKVVLYGMDVGHEARIRVNWDYDVFLPRGYWNVVAFEDFLRRCVGLLGRLAIDPTTSFWTDELKRYVSNGVWPFVGTEEVTLYDATGMEAFKPSSIENPIKEPVKLEFVDAEPSRAIANAQMALNGCFDKVQEKKTAGVTDFEAEKESIGDSFLVYIPAFIERFERPKVRVMKLQVAYKL